MTSIRFSEKTPLNFHDVTKFERQYPSRLFGKGTFKYDFS